MRILLPPSESKAAPASGPRLSMDSMSFPVLGPIRQQVAASLVDLCREDPEAARSALRLGVSQADEVARNARLLEAPCAPAWQVYSGVLFSALDVASLPDPRHAEDALLVASGLFGLIRAGDLIPAYRLSGSVRLPGLPPHGQLWSGPLGEVLCRVAAEHLVIDMRSQTYATWFRLRGPGCVNIRVMSIRSGRRVPVSHHNKVTKGLVARDLLRSVAAPRNAAEVVDVLRAVGWQVETGPDGRIEILARE